MGKEEYRLYLVNNEQGFPNFVGDVKLPSVPEKGTSITYTQDKNLQQIHSGKYIVHDINYFIRDSGDRKRHV